MTSLQKTVGALLYLLGSIGLCVFYGLRWFNDGNAKKLGYSGKWPPIVNMCPDYFSLYTNPLDKKQYCVDYVGFSAQINKFKSGDEIKTFNGKLSPLSIPQGTNAIETNLTTAQNCLICQTTGLTWEGVYDGNSCTTYIGSPGSLAARGCPTPTGAQS